LITNLVKKQKEAVSGGSPLNAGKKKGGLMLDSDGDEDEEEVTINDTTNLFTPEVQEELLSFHDKVITASVSVELRIPDEES
jgi:hypothetical protein